MDGAAIQKLVDGLAPGGTLTLTPGSALNAKRIDALLTGLFRGKLVAVLGAPQVGETSVAYPDAKLDTTTFSLYPKGTPAAAPLTFLTGADAELDLVLAPVLPDGWTFATSFPEIGKDTSAAVNDLALSRVGIAIDSSKSATAGLLAATIASAQSAIAEFGWLLGASVDVKGPFGMVVDGKGAQRPDLTLSSAAIQGPEVSGFTFDIYLNLRCSPASVTLADGSIPLLTAVDLTAALVAGKVTLPILIGISGKDQTTYPIRLDPAAQAPQLDSLDDLSGFTFGASPGTVVASAKTPIGTLSLDYVYATFDTVGKGISNLTFQVSLGTQWAVIDDVFALDGLFVQVKVPALFKGGSPPGGGPGFSVTLGARFEIPPAVLIAAASYPDETLSLGLAPGSSIDIDAFLKRFARGVSLPGNSTLAITEFNALAAIKESTYSLSCEADGDLSVIPGFDLTEVKMAITYAAGAVQSFAFACNFTIAKAPLVLDVEYSGSDKSWMISGGSVPNSAINLTDLAADILRIFNVDVNAEALPAIVMTKLDMSYHTVSGDFAFDTTIGTVTSDDPLLKKIQGSIALARTEGKWSGTITGTTEFGNNLVQVVLDFHQNETLTLSWTGENGKTLAIADLCAPFGVTPPHIPDGLDLAITSFTGTYDITNTLLVLEASTASTRIVFAAWKGAGGWQVFFGLATGKTIGLSDLPLIGAKLASIASVALEDIVAELSSAQISTGDAKTLNDDIKSGYPKPPVSGMDAGVALAMTFDAGGSKTPISIGTGGKSTGGGGGAQTLARLGRRAAFLAGAGDAPANGPPPQIASDGTHWFTVQKTFGPVSIQKIGVRYQDSTLWALMNASLSIGGLTISLIGLGAGSPLSSFEPHFTISGVDVTFSEGPVTASGGFVGTIQPVNLYGEMLLSVPEFSLGALGGFAMVGDEPSFFLYLTLDMPLGGPPFFFVTGLAVGLGFNRSLVVPPVSGVATFPLVEWATGGGPSSIAGGDVGQQVTDALTLLAQSGIIAPKIGEYWLAAGVRFTSFELVDAFALVAVKFGSDFEVDLLGLARVALPPPPQNPEPVVYIELALEVSFKPSEGLLAISGQLTPNSYLLAKDCHLTGGFAFYVWFAGEHEGEFLVTIGGYSPRFTPPKYYPSVPRLGLRWQVTGALTITGQEYFAVTSSAVMAGGSLSAVWDGGSISAWFSVEVDFLLVYQPFHYYLSASCQLGASFKIDLLFTSITITIHLGVGIEIWGPDFTGRAHVDLSIISFTIPFGHSDQNTSTTILWSDFVTNLLPKKSGQQQKATPAPPTFGRRGRRRLADAAPPQADTPPPAVVQVTVSQGLLKTLTNDDVTPNDTVINYVVDGEKAQLTIISAIPIKPSDPADPAKDFSSNIVLAPADDQPKDSNGQAITPNFGFGVGPTATAPAQFKSTLAVQVGSVEPVTFNAIWSLKNVPTALWQTRSFSDKGVPQNVDPLNGTTIPNVPVGWTLIATAPAPDRTPLPIPIEYLKYTIDPKIQHFAFSAPTPPAADGFAGQTVPGTIASGLALANRPTLLGAINLMGIAVPTVVDVGDLGNAATDYLEDDPVLALLGEAK